MDRKQALEKAFTAGKAGALCAKPGTCEIVFVHCEAPTFYTLAGKAQRLPRQYTSWPCVGHETSLADWQAEPLAGIDAGHVAHIEAEGTDAELLRWVACAL